MSLLQARRVAQRLVKRYRLSPPVDVEALAGALGLTVVEWDFPAEIDGMIRSEGNSWYIGVNRRRDRNRKRFIIAHEIMHFFLHRGNRFSHCFSMTNEELEANVGASELLLPADSVAELALDAIGLAEYLGVPEEVVSYRTFGLWLGGQLEEGPGDEGWSLRARLQRGASEKGLLA